MQSEPPRCSTASIGSAVPRAPLPRGRSVSRMRHSLPHSLTPKVHVLRLSGFRIEEGVTLPSRGRGVCFEVAPRSNRGDTQTSEIRRDAVVARRPAGVGARPELWVAPAAAPAARAGPGSHLVVALALPFVASAARVALRAGELAAVARAGGCGGAEGVSVMKRRERERKL